MALTFTSTSYVGELAAEPIYDMLKAGDTIKKNALLLW